MKLQSFCTALGLTALTLSVSTFPGFSQDNSSANQPNQVTFFCQEVFDSASGEKIPATVAWIPERQAHVRFIGWKSQYFEKSGCSPQKRYQEVSNKFKNFQEAGLLNYLKTGKINNGISVICAVKSNEETCNGNNQLFQLKTGSDPELVLKQLVNIAVGTSSKEILQSTGGKTYVNVGNYLQNAPVVNVEK